ncbi:hypothetical protein [Rhodopseudomonas pseudopalustris]|uniref:Uncharacterized protein n=1 Tax=Rhodopseudomonas pseudopalustris TaxID=1513892 RepID=A0A1H8PGS5_9BRAD|nr:hypothetical protein [Rhodopseudomonas pseudopalustris]SEO41130.1 hypothetical protein SAMN05444123_102554 [Rhodopseudomonas pseudopalustris]
MRNEPLLTVAPLTSVSSLAELYAIALFQAETASTRYQQLVASADPSFVPVRRVFEILTQIDRERARTIILGSLASLNKRPDSADLRWTPTDIVPADELSDVVNSSLSTAYDAWALAVRHRERAFVFWTYVASLATDRGVCAVAEDFARAALQDGSLLRRERRLAWRSLSESGRDGGTPVSEPDSAALLESLLLKDIKLWSQQLTPQQCDVLSKLMPSPLPPASEPQEDIADAGTLDQIRRRVLQRAEQLSELYLEEADRAADEFSLELAQKLAAQSIARLARLRDVASAASVRPS